MNRMRCLRSHWMVLAAAMMVAGTGCDRPKSDPSSDEGAAPANAPLATRAAIVLALGEQQFDLRPEGEGYKLSFPGGKGKVKVESDRVKVKLAAEAKVKKKDSGFKVYDGSDTAVLKGKYHGAGWKLSREDGAEVAKLDGKGGQAGGAAIVVRRDGERWVVTRAGATVATATGLTSGASAALLGVTEVPPEQRIGMAVFAEEFRR